MVLKRSFSDFGEPLISCNNTVVLLDFKVPGGFRIRTFHSFFSGSLSGGGLERYFLRFLGFGEEFGMPLGTIWAPFSLFFPGLRIDRILG